MNPDIKALIHKAKKSLEAARSLAKDQHFDFAASRAYFTMFYIAEALLAAIGQSYNKHSGDLPSISFQCGPLMPGYLPTSFQAFVKSQDERNLAGPTGN